MILSLFAMSFVVLCIYAALIDLETMTIPNWLNGWLAFLAIPALIVAAPGWEVAGAHLLIGAIAICATIGLFFVGAFGGGDAKFIPAVLLWIGPAGAMPFLLATAIAGGILTMVILAARYFFPVGVNPGFGVATFEEQKGVPYGVAIAAGAFYALPNSPLLTDFLRQIQQIG